MTYLNTSQVAKYHGVTISAVRLAIKNGRLKAEKKNHIFQIAFKDLIDFIESRYSRKLSLVDGEKLYDVEKGLYDIKSASEIFMYPIQKFYYGIRKKNLPYTRKNKAYILKEEDIIRFLKNR
jgi:hypothetical protein